MWSRPLPLMAPSTALVLRAGQSLLPILAPPFLLSAFFTVETRTRKDSFLSPTSRLAPPFPAERCVHSFLLETPIGRKQFNTKTKHPPSYLVQQTLSA